MKYDCLEVLLYSVLNKLRFVLVRKILFCTILNVCIAFEMINDYLRYIDTRVHRNIRKVVQLSFQKWFSY